MDMALTLKSLPTRTPTHLGCSRTPLLSAQLPITTWLRTTAPASAWLPDSPPRHPLPHTFSAVAGLVPRYYHLLHLLHLTVARHGISIGLVTRFPATAPATSHFLGGRGLGPPLLPPPSPSPPHGGAPRLRHRLWHPVPCYGTTSHFLGGRALRRALLLHITVARHGIGIGLVTRFPTTAPATSQFLGGRGLCSPATTTSTSSTSRLCATASASALAPGSLLWHHLTLPRRSRAPAYAPTPHYGCAPRHRHRLGYPIPRHGTRYLTIPRRSRALFTRYYHILHLLHLLHLTVACHSIGIGLVTRFPATAPATSHFLGGGRGLCSPATTTSTSSTSRLHAMALALAW